MNLANVSNGRTLNLDYMQYMVVGERQSSVLGKYWVVEFAVYPYGQVFDSNPYLSPEEAQAFIDELVNS